MVKPENLVEVECPILNQYEVEEFIKEFRKAPERGLGLKVQIFLGEEIASAKSSPASNKSC